MPVNVEVEKELDGRWIVEFVDEPGIMAYGASPEDAYRQCLKLQAAVARDSLDQSAVEQLA